MKYDQLSSPLQRQILEDRAAGYRSPYAAPDADALRREPGKDRPNPLRPAYVRDVEAILHSAYYNRYADKTQVFSFYRNDDITRRALHVQLVSRIARNIGAALGLNLDLIEAIALGHDIGHTPFGHAGERHLGELYHAHTGRYFQHNLHSVRCLDGIVPYNISLQTLDGIACHNGEYELDEYRPRGAGDFDSFDRMLDEASRDERGSVHLTPMTLEGCVVRVCDMIAYLGKDRQDAVRARLIEDESVFEDGPLGSHNAEIINNLTVNLVENSYGRDHLRLSPEYFEALRRCKQQNYEIIYKSPLVAAVYDESVRPMFHLVYERLLEDLTVGRADSPIFRHHIEFVERQPAKYARRRPYREEEPNQIVVDYMASMTDDYFIDLYAHLFPDQKTTISYQPYF